MANTAKSVDEAAGSMIAFSRSVRKWSQSQLAEAVNSRGLQLAQQTIAKIEAGTRPLKLTEAVVFAESFGVGVDHLLGFADAGYTRMSMEVQVDELKAARSAIMEAIGQYSKAVVEAALLSARIEDSAAAESSRLGEVETIDERAWERLESAVKAAAAFDWVGAYTQAEREEVSALGDDDDRAGVEKLLRAQPSTGDGQVAYYPPGTGGAQAFEPSDPFEPSR